MFRHRLIFFALLMFTFHIFQATTFAATQTVVTAGPGGQFASIQAAIDSITDATLNRPYLIQVAAGVYQETVHMKEFVSIRGAGESNTKITGFVPDFFAHGVLSGANHAELRNLTVESTGGDFYSIAIYNEGVSPAISNVTALAQSGSWCFAIYNIDASPDLTRVKAQCSGAKSLNYGIITFNNFSGGRMDWIEASASGGSVNCAISNQQSSPVMSHIKAEASDSTDLFQGQSNGICNASSSPRMTNIEAAASNSKNNFGIVNITSSPDMQNVVATGSGGAVNMGINNVLGSAPRMRRVRSFAKGGSVSTNTGIGNQDDSSVDMQNVTSVATGDPGSSNNGISNSFSNAIANKSTFAGRGGDINRGVLNVGDHNQYQVDLTGVIVEGSTNTIRNDEAFTTVIKNGQLLGGPVTGGGTVICVQTYDENGVLYEMTCP